MKLLSPAKINLFLRVLNKRQDGFHNLETLMQTIDLCDTVTIEKSTEDRITCSDSTIPTDACNLAWKARELYRTYTQQSFPVSIHIEKQIPHGAGLGGGSGNAATVLYGLNALCGSPATISELQTWSSEIGSDIPFFFSSGTALCSGRGEEVEEAKVDIPEDLWIAKPPYGLSTPEVYKALKLRPYETGHFEMCNDLEDAALRVKPELQEFKKELLSEGFETVLMTGSGSAFFCVGHPKNAGFQGWKVGKIGRKESQWYGVNDGC